MLWRCLIIELLLYSMFAFQHFLSGQGQLLFTEHTGSMRPHVFLFYHFLKHAFVIFVFFSEKENGLFQEKIVLKICRNAYFEM